MSASNALEGDPAVAEYMGSKAFAALTPPVAAAVKSALAAAPGPDARRATLDLLRTPKWLMLGSATDAASCTSDGATAQLRILDWVQATSARSGAETPALADVRVSADVAQLRAVLVVEDVRHIDATLAHIAGRLSHATPAFAAPWCGPSGGTTNAGGDCDDTTGCDVENGGSADPGSSGSGNSDDDPYCTTLCDDEGNAGTTRAANERQDSGIEARRALGAMFAAFEVQAPSRAMLQEWSALRATYQTTLARIAPPARDALRAARRGGSATLARAASGQDARAAQRFDQAALLVDHMVRGRAAFSADAMNLVHAVVSDRQPGVTRTAGQDVRNGARRDRAYLPGSQVDGAVAELFTGVRGLARSGAPTPQVAALFDQRLISVHPYVDANGRTTRLMTDWLLAKDGYPPVVATTSSHCTALFSKSRQAGAEAGAHLERITDGMRRAVAIVTAAS